MKINMDLDGGCMPLYTSKYLNKLFLKQEETTKYAENSLPIPRDNMKNPFLSRIFHHNCKETRIKR
jgi:hypothetical protein